ncbi:MAG: AEC family transporter [Lautropia sp.]
MLSVANTTIPFFALVLCGWLAARARRLPDQAVAALNGFILWFALPAMLFRFVARAEVEDVVNPRVFLAYAGVGVLVFCVSVAGLRLGNHDNWVDAAFGGLAAAWPNWGYMGFGLLPAIFGAESIGLIVSAGIADLILLMPLALLFASRHAAGPGQSAALAGLLGVSRNPLIWAILAGLVVSLLRLPIPTAIDEFLRLLGTAAGPVALFSIGVSLYRPRRAKVRTETWILVATKLILHPLLMWVMAARIFGFDPTTSAVLALIAALPAAGTAFLFTERHGGDVDRIAGLILISTALAFATFTVAVGLTGH